MAERCVVSPLPLCVMAGSVEEPVLVALASICADTVVAAKAIAKALVMVFMVLVRLGLVWSVLFRRS